MKIEDFYYLGYVAKTFGFEGQVVVSLDADPTPDLRTTEPVFILLEGKLVPFFIHKITTRAKGKEALIQFLDVDTEEAARRICESPVYLPVSKRPEPEDDSFYYDELTGYQAFLSDGNQLGHITEILEYPGNPLFSIAGDRGEILIPVHDEFIHALDREARKIWLNPPEGLMDLFAGE